MTVHGNLNKALEHMAQANLLPTPVFDYFNGTAAAVGTSSDLEDLCTDVWVRVATLSGGETVQIQGTVDGTVWSAAIGPYDTSTGNFLAAAATLGNGVYRLPIKLIAQFRKLKLVKSAGVNGFVGGFFYAKLPRKR